MISKIIDTILLVIVIVSVALVACAPYSSTNVGRNASVQADVGISQILLNQPPPDLGGYSFERDILTQIYFARNTQVATWSYSINMDGTIGLELCPSIGYPIPYSTQLTSPDRLASNAYYDSAVLSNPEPNSLYPPSDAAATLVSCVNEDGTISVIYWEWYVAAFPFRVQAEESLVRTSDSSFTIDTRK